MYVGPDALSATVSFVLDIDPSSSNCRLDEDETTSGAPWPAGADAGGVGGLRDAGAPLARLAGHLAESAMAGTVRGRSRTA